MTCRNGSHYECNKCKEPCAEREDRAAESIYTVSSMDNETLNGVERLVVGSYRTAERAIEECIDYIMQRLDCNGDLAYGFANDKGHPEAAGFMKETTDEWGRSTWAVADPAAMRQFIRDELEYQMCYYVWDGEDYYYFDVDENDLVD